MSININIDDPRARPNARPARPTSNRGTLTFIAEIEERGRPDVFRNLTRGVDEIVEPSPSDPVQKPVTLSLDPALLTLSILNLGLRGLNTPLNLGSVSSTLSASAEFTTSNNAVRKDLGNVSTTLTVDSNFLSTSNLRKDLGNLSSTLTVDGSFLAIANVRKDLGSVDVSLEASSMSVGIDTNLGNVFTTLSASSISLAEQLNLGTVSSTLTVDAEFEGVENQRKDLGSVDVSLEASSMSVRADVNLGNVFTVLTASSISLADRIVLGNVSSTLTVTADFLATDNQRKALGLVETNLEASGLSLATDIGNLATVETDLEANVLSLNTDLIFSLPDDMVTPPDIDP